jgi:Na+-transporting NADH:ubiquinone oxidoreductase subunit NqrD
MIDPELKKHLEIIENELAHMRKETVSLKASLVRGLIYGAGYILGAALILIIIGWILNIVGIIPAFNEGVKEFRDALQQVGGPIK